MDIGVLTKRRSASLTLGILVRRASALESASGVRVLFAFTSSTGNLDDRPSRRFDVKKKPKRFANVRASCQNI